eukprot:Hpha_TRINITY_DN14949_c3_g4::TRINITY_DN14949_c3_g4_i1::g.144180::m.144180
MSASPEGSPKAGPAPDKRRDPADGQLLSQQEFREKYGGIREWKAAETRRAPGGALFTKAEFKEKYGGYQEWDAAGGGKGGPPARGSHWDELRYDTDHRAYTKRQWFDLYGGFEEWDAAARLPINQAKGKGKGKGWGMGPPRGAVRPETLQKRKEAAGEGRRLIVGNLQWRVAWQDLKDAFATIGPVVHADIFTEYDGRSKGVGVVEYKEQADAQRAIESLNDTELHGRKIWVREDRDTK